MIVGWILTFCWFIIFLFIIRKIKFFVPENISFQLAALVFTIKCAGAITVGLLYSYYYNGGDTFTLFNDSSILFDALKSNPADYFKMLLGIDSDNPYLKEMYFAKMNAWYNNEYDILFNDSRTIIRIHSFIRIFSFGKYYVHAVFFSFLSFAGLTALYRTFSQAIKKHYESFYAAIFLIPSLAFWGSGVLKEAVVLFAAGFLIYSLWQLTIRKSILNFVILFLSSSLLILTRFYFLVALLPGVTGFLLAINKKRIWQKFLVTHAVWIAALFCFHFVNPSCDIPCIISAKQNNFINLAISGNAGSILTEKKLEPDWNDIITKSPMAFFTTLTKPLSFHSGNILSRISSLEILFIILMLLEAIILFRKPAKEDTSLLLFCLSFTVITFTFIGLTTPVAGALVRYKIIALPFLVFLAGYFISNSKMFVKKDVVQAT